MDFDKSNSTGYQVNLLARLFAQELEERLRPLGLRIGAFPALLHLWDNEGLTQGELVKLLEIEQPTLAATLSRMERDGLIRRTKDDADGRAQRIWLTPHSRQLEKQAKEAAANVNNFALSRLSEAESGLLLTLMKGIIEQLKRG